jgi:hypothetical protein
MLLGTGQYEPFLNFKRHIKTASINIPDSDEYPMIPCKVKIPFDDPIIIKTVAVISSATPSVKKTRILRLSIFLRCSVNIAIEYDASANTTIMVPV